MNTNTKTVNEMYKITLPQGQKHDRDSIIQKIRSAIGEDFIYYNVSFILLFKLSYSNFFFFSMKNTLVIQHST